MSPSDHTLKLLWGEAANLCAMCKRPLTEVSDPRRRTVVGEGAHIVAKSPIGPRGAGARPADIDGYENLILLCPTDHRIIDDQPDRYTVDWLCERKETHIAWVKATLSSSIAIRPDPGPRDQMLRGYGLDSWMVPPCANGPEIQVRSAVALPHPLARLSHQPEPLGALLTLEAREELILDVLERSNLTEVFRQQQKSWHWTSDGGWEIQGSAPGQEVTVASFAIGWDIYRLRPPIALRCIVLSGRTTDEGGRGLVVALDLYMNVLELDSERRASEIRHATTPCPAPGALHLREFAGLVAVLVAEAGPLGAELLAPLTGLEPEAGGHIATWLRHDGLELGRFIDLRGLRRLPNPASPTRAEVAEPWPLASGREPGEQRVAATLVASALRSNDYRGVQPTIERIFSSHG